MSSGELARIEAALRAAGFPIAGPGDEPPVCRCASCGCGLFSHRHDLAGTCAGCRRCPGWLPPGGRGRCRWM